MKLTAVILIIILGFVCYGNSLDGKFIRDDQALIKNNTLIRSASGVLSYFTGASALGARQKWGSYRPLQMITYALDYSLWKLDVKGYHLTNTILHILAALAIYWFVYFLFGDPLLSLFTGVLFVANPLHTEAVTYMSGRADSLALLFMLLSFIFYIKYIHAGGAGIFVLILLSYALALLSRENSLILPALLLLYHYTFKKKFKPIAFFSISALAFIYGLARLTALRSLSSDIVNTSTLLQRIPGFFVAITNYSRLLLLPLNLHTGYMPTLFKPGDPRMLVGLLIMVILLVYAFRKRRGDSPAFFSILWFFIALAPVSNLYPINAYMSEHWLYTPSIGFFLVLAGWIRSLYGKKGYKTLAFIIIISLTSFYSYLTIRQNDYWKEPLLFYKRTIEYAPGNYGEHVNLGLEYSHIGKKNEAEIAFKRALAINPRYADAHYNLGKLECDRGEKKKALASFKKAVEFNPRHPEAHHNLGNAYNDLGEKVLAVASYKKVIEINPRYADSYYALGNIYYEAGNRGKAIGMYRKVVEINPYDAEVLYNLAVAYYYEKRYRLAVRYCDRALALGYRASPKLLELLKPFRKK